jgi:riboflavin synthase
MFTGLIEEVGHVASVVRRGRVADLSIQARKVLDGLAAGDSIAVSGACLTVTAFSETAFIAQAVEETLGRTTIGSLMQGDPVNLERALRLGDRLGGHIVQGHVDGVGRIVSVAGTGDNALISVAVDSGIERYIVEKGSVTVDGISLTVTFAKEGMFGVSVIPHTLGATTLERARAGDRVNIETDILAKYIEKLMRGGGALTLETLGEMGF